MKTSLYLTLGVCLALAGPAAAQQSSSMPLAKELGTLLDQKKLDSVAARMPGDENRFVAALVIRTPSCWSSARNTAFRYSTGAYLGAALSGRVHGIAQRRHRRWKILRLRHGRQRHPAVDRQAGKRRRLQGRPAAGDDERRLARTEALEGGVLQAHRRSRSSIREDAPGPGRATERRQQRQRVTRVSCASRPRHGSDGTCRGCHGRRRRIAIADTAGRGPSWRWFHQKRLWQHIVRSAAEFRASSSLRAAWSAAGPATGRPHRNR